MKIVFFGTPDFSIPSLTSIIDSNHTLLLVITNPDQKSGRGLNKNPSSVKQFCDTKNINCKSFDNLDDKNTYNYWNKKYYKCTVLNNSFFTLKEIYKKIKMKKFSKENSKKELYR